MRFLSWLFLAQILVSCGSAETSNLSSTVQSNAAQGAARSLQTFYDESGLWSGEWWQSANALTALVDYMRLSGDRSYLGVIEKTYRDNKGQDFINEYFDDEAWWGLAWVRSFDLTGDGKYLDAAAKIADDMYNSGWDAVCGGGIWWSRKRETKNAIENALFIKLAAALHNRRPADGRFLSRAVSDWSWFYQSGLIDDRNIVADKLIGCRRENLSPAWTYNQGVILGAATELFKATGNQSYLDAAKATAYAAMSYVSKDGILVEATDTSCGECRGDERLFKGVFMRNLREFYYARPDSTIRTYILNNAQTAWDRARDSYDYYGFHWSSGLDRKDAGRQSSALDLMNALYVL